MPRHRIVLAVLTVSSLLSGCKVKELVTSAIAAKDAVKAASAATTTAAPGTTHGSFTPPADGHLTGTEVENYIKIRQRAKQFEEAGRHDMEQRAKAMEGKQPSLADMVGAAGNLENLVAADAKASKELGYNVDEYDWVRQQMIDASMAGAADMGKVAAAKVAVEQQASLQKSIDTAPDESSKEIYRGMMADAEKSRKEAIAAEEPQSAAMVYNKELIAKYEDVTRPLMELFLRGTGHEAEISKAIDDVKKQAAP